MSLHVPACPRTSRTAGGPDLRAWLGAQNAPGRPRTVTRTCHLPEPWTRLLPRQKTPGEALRASPTLPGGQSCCKSRVCDGKSPAVPQPEKGEQRSAAAAPRCSCQPPAQRAAASSGPQALNPDRQRSHGLIPGGPWGRRNGAPLWQKPEFQRGLPMSRIYGTQTWHRDGFLLCVYRGSTAGLCQGHGSAPPAPRRSCLCLDMRPAGSPQHHGFQQKP